MSKTHILPILFFSALLAACGRNDDTGYEGLYRAGDVAVDSVSVSVGGVILFEADSADRKLDSGIPLLDALYSDSITGPVNQSPAPLALSLFGASASPSDAMEMLRRAPESPEWAEAAWQVYLSSGDKDWLREAYNTLMARWRDDKKYQSGVLVEGPDSVLTDSYPAWLKGSTLLSSVSLRRNAYRYATLRRMADMASVLSLYAEMEWRSEAAEVREALNNRFFSPRLGTYGRYLYGDYYPLISRSADVRANLVCALSGIAIPEMARSIVANIPMLPLGYTLFYPLDTPAPVYDPSATAMMAATAAEAGNQEVFTRSLWALAALQARDKEYGGLLRATVERSLFGLSLTPEGLQINPFIPDTFKGDKRLKDIQVRKAVIDLTVSGTGDRVAAMTLDGEPVTSPLPYSLEGNHIVEITMAANRLSENEAPSVGIREAAILPPPPAFTVENGLLHTAARPEHILSLNGVTFDVSSEKTIPLTDTLTEGITTVALLPVADGYEGLSDKPAVITPPGTRIDIPATSITPRRPPLHLIKDRETAGKYIELAPRHNTRLTFYANAPADGIYFVSILYANGGKSDGVWKLENLDDPDVAGNTFIICPPVREFDWITTSRSTIASLRLRRGQNRLSLTHRAGTVLLNHITLLRK